MAAQHGFGIIGAGVWGETHLKAYSGHPSAVVAGICDTDQDLLRARADQYGVPFATVDYRELLSRPEITAVSIATPDHLHREIATAACEAGKHVLIEKPMATTTEDCQAMIAAAERAGVLLMVDFHNRFNPAFTKVKDAIVQGRIGEPRNASIRLSDSWWVPTKMWGWGGRTTVAWFLASHAVDLARWLFDDEVVRVYSVARRQVLRAMGVDTPDFFQTILEFGRGGVAHLENSWILSDTHPTIFDFKFELQGDKGTATADLSTHRMLQIHDRNGTELPDMAVVLDVRGKPGGFGVDSIAHFADCVAGDATPASTPQDGLRNTQVLCALHESARSGQPVAL